MTPERPSSGFYELQMPARPPAPRTFYSQAHQALRRWMRRAR